MRRVPQFRNLALHLRDDRLGFKFHDGLRGSKLLGGIEFHAKISGVFSFWDYIRLRRRSRSFMPLGCLNFGHLVCI